MFRQAKQVRDLRAGAADVLVLKPLQLGGIGATARVAREAMAAGRKVTITTSIDTGIGTAAALHIASALAGATAHGLATLALLEASPIEGGLEIARGQMSVPAGGGLGVMVDRDAMGRYVVAEPLSG